MTIENSRQAANRMAAEARRRKSSQESAQDTAAQIRQQVANISPHAAESLGGALDPSKGYSLDPNARPSDLPEPGSAPGGAAERRVGNMFDPQGQSRTMQDGAAGPLPDDHDQLVGQGIGGPAQPPQQPPQAPQQGRAPAVRPGPVKQQHPILAQLREDLGISSVKPVDVQIGAHTWTMMLLTPGDLATASRLADQLAVGQVEARLVYETAVAAHAVVAIDHVPTYQVFGVEPPPAMHVTNPLRPPRSVRYMAAGNLYDFIQDEGRTQLSSKLYAAYVDKVDVSGEVQSYLDDPANAKATYRCPKDNCSQEVTVTPRYKPGTRDMILPFCQWHGEPMDLISETAGADSPL